MAIKHYAGAIEHPLTQAEKDIFDRSVKDIKSTLSLFGYAPEAIEQLTMELRCYSLTISDEEARSGAWHRHATGTPFYELSIKAPGSVMEMRIDETRAYNQNSPATQALMLAFECGINIGNNMATYLQNVYPQEKFDDLCAGGAGMGFGPMDVQTTFAVPVDKYMRVFSQALFWRLKALDDEGQQREKKRADMDKGFDQAIEDFTAAVDGKKPEAKAKKPSGPKP